MDESTHHPGDIVRKGTGATLYTVLGDLGSITVIKSHSSGKCTSQLTRKLRLVAPASTTALAGATRPEPTRTTRMAPR